MPSIARKGDKALPHTCETTHTPTLLKTSRSVFLNSRGVGRKNDVFDCTDTVARGSTTVFVQSRGIGRIGDLTNGHGCFPPTIIIEGSPDAFSN